MTDELNLTTPAEAPQPDPHQALAQSIAEAIAKSGGKAEVRINPTVNAVPAHIAANILEFLKRVELTGMEAIAWGEAFSHMQQYVPQAGAAPGVPFGGLPAKKA